ncbi:hypothetical protein HYC85_029199 [Camellia sinensis]|uniref:Uncharacterized protein n=1 Tax=Camellia sinensis TaxID=4442 RepID=A0A7J7FZP8_CAMSI|nr:hypothetical protein HYC85_029199 [Camellia sinensis]
MASSSRPLTLFPDLNDLIISAGPSAPTPTLPVIPLPNIPMMSIEQIMTAQSDIQANHFTLMSCMETVTAVTKLTHRLQNRTSELHQVNAQLSLLQRMYKDARAEIGTLKAENKELKRKTTSMAQFGAMSGSRCSRRKHGSRGVKGRLRHAKLSLLRNQQAADEELSAYRYGPSRQGISGSLYPSIRALKHFLKIGIATVTPYLYL